MRLFTMRNDLFLERVQPTALLFGHIELRLAELQYTCRQIYVDPSLISYAVKLVGATRRDRKSVV